MKTTIKPPDAQIDRAIFFTKSSCLALDNPESGDDDVSNIAAGHAGGFVRF
jgi:hypothetical protein